MDTACCNRHGGCSSKLERSPDQLVGVFGTMTGTIVTLDRNCYMVLVPTREKGTQTCGSWDRSYLNPRMVEGFLNAHPFSVEERREKNAAE